MPNPTTGRTSSAEEFVTKTPGDRRGVASLKKPNGKRQESAHFLDIYTDTVMKRWDASMLVVRFSSWRFRGPIGRNIRVKLDDVCNGKRKVLNNIESHQI